MQSREQRELKKDFIISAFLLMASLVYISLTIFVTSKWLKLNTLTNFVTRADKNCHFQPVQNLGYNPKSAIIKVLHFMPELAQKLLYNK